MLSPNHDPLQGDQKEEELMRVHRRKVLKGLAATGVSVAALRAPYVHAQAPFKIGLLTVKTGPLAQGGIQMEQGIARLAQGEGQHARGRKIDFISADTGGNPAGAKTKAQELIERDKVNVILGPLAAFELLAITDYVRDNQTPLISLAAAEDVTQRKANPFIIRPSATSAQCCHVMGDYAAKELKFKRARDYLGGLRVRLRADGGLPARVRGQRRQGGEEAVAAAGDAGLHALHRADRQCRLRVQRLCRLESGEVHALLSPISAEGPHPAARRLDRHGRRAAAQPRRRGASASVRCLVFGRSSYESNKRFVADMQKDYNVLPGGYSAGMYIAGQCVEAAIQKARQGRRSQGVWRALHASR
jgi:branched-chain amino acid transport system substrate-binding protein